MAINVIGIQEHAGERAILCSHKGQCKKRPIISSYTGIHNVLDVHSSEKQQCAEAIQEP